MSDTQNQEVNTEVEAVAQDQPQYSDIELKAMEMGWRPKDEFNGDETDFIDAKEFVARKPLYDKIAHQSKQMKNLTNAVEALKEHYTMVQKTEYNRALTALRNERKQAIAEGDGERVDAIEQQMDRAKEQVAEIERAAKTPIVEEVQQVHPELAEWQSKNQWYVSGPQYMKAFADQVGAQLAQSGMHRSDVLTEVAKRVRQEFPEKFKNPNKADAPAVGNARVTAKPAKGAEIQLTEQERNIMNTLVKGGHITKEKYLADLKAAKERN